MVEQTSRAGPRTERADSRAATGAQSRAARSPRRASTAGARYRSADAESAPAAHAVRRAALDELAQSIRSHGVIQPILVRARRRPLRDRRRRAPLARGAARRPAQGAGRRARRRRRGAARVALIENIQRENLNPIEEAQAYRRLTDEFQLSQEADRHRGRQGSRDDRQLPAAAAASRGSAKRSRVRRRCRWAMPARCCRDRRSGPTPHRARSRRARALVRETEALVARERAGRAPAAAERRFHTRAAEDRLQARPRHPRAHRPQGPGRTHRDRFQYEDELQRLFER